MKKTILPIIAATIWISASEFIRNQLLLQSFWADHYRAMGIRFPSSPVNGAVWGIWSLVFAITIFIIAKKFTLTQATFFCWVYAFIMMWLVIGNLSVLPYGILLYAIPLSLFETFIATVIIKKLS